jgi:hypothetical protein
MTKGYLKTSSLPEAMMSLFLVLMRTSIRTLLLVKREYPELTALVGRALTIKAQVVGTTKLILMSILPQAIMDTCLHTYPLGQTNGHYLKAHLF